MPSQYIIKFKDKQDLKAYVLVLSGNDNTALHLIHLGLVLNLITAEFLNA